LTLVFNISTTRGTFLQYVSRFINFMWKSSEMKRAITERLEPDSPDTSMTSPPVDRTYSSTILPPRNDIMYALYIMSLYNYDYEIIRL